MTHNDKTASNIAENFQSTLESTSGFVSDSEENTSTAVPSQIEEESTYGIIAQGNVFETTDKAKDLATTTPSDSKSLTD